MPRIVGELSVSDERQWMSAHDMAFFSDFAMRALERAALDHAEVRLHAMRAETIHVRDGEVQRVANAHEIGLTVRAIVGGRPGFAGTMVMTPDGIRRAVRIAIDGTVAHPLRPNTGKQRRELAPQLAKGCAARPPGRISPVEVSIPERVETVNDAVIPDWRGRPAGRSSYELRVEDSIQYIQTTDGADAWAEVPRTFVRSSLVGGRAASRETMMAWYGRSGGWDAMDWERLRKRTARQAAWLEKSQQAVRPQTRGVVDLVLGPEVVAMIIHETLGHALEADRILGREGHLGGESFVTPDTLGQRVGSPQISIVDDPTIPGSFGFHLFDDEGIVGRRRDLVRQGHVRELLHDRRTASVLEADVNGSARAAAPTLEPLPRMSNTYLSPSSSTPSELLEETRSGLFIESYGEWNVDDTRSTIRFVGRRAYEIVNGHLGVPVRNPEITLGTTTLLSAVDLVANDLEFWSATCGKGDPYQPLPVDSGGPTVRVRGVPLGAR